MGKILFTIKQKLAVLGWILTTGIWNDSARYDDNGV